VADRAAIRQLSGLLPFSTNASLALTSTIPDLAEWLNLLQMKGKPTEKALRLKLLSQYRAKRKLLLTHDYWEEKLISRSISGVLPTKNFFLRLYPHAMTNDHCRHCHMASETAEHLLFDCPLYFSNNILRTSYVSLTDLQQALLDPRRNKEARRILFKHVRKNKVFKRY
jgi:hypothetical protein